jgi:hypothetical protein
MQLVDFLGNVDDVGGGVAEVVSLQSSRCGSRSLTAMVEAGQAILA